MELDKKREDFKKALNRLKESFFEAQKRVDQKEFEFFRDSTIQRFEFTLEIMWKSIKTYLYEFEGVECRSPKSCLREFFSLGNLSEEDVVLALKMVDDRNLASHTYHEDIANDIFNSIEKYIKLLEKIYESIK